MKSHLRLCHETVRYFERKDVLRHGIHHLQYCLFQCLFMLLVLAVNVDMSTKTKTIKQRACCNTQPAVDYTCTLHVT